MMYVVPFVLYSSTIQIMYVNNLLVSIVITRSNVCSAVHSAVVVWY